jgi:D-alanyl-D-alanine carboxypeptidase (penicillin-binding protein 5/6)
LAAQKRFRRHDECARQGDRPHDIAFREFERPSRSRALHDRERSGEARAHVIHDYPQYYELFQNSRFHLEQYPPAQSATPLVDENIGVDGLKTGHTEAAGYGIVASSLRNGRRLILVINGLKSERERINEARRLLDIGYRDFRDYKLAEKGKVLGDANLGRTKTTVRVTVKDPLTVLLPVESRRDLKVTLRYDGPMKAPIAAGQQIGTVTVTVPGKPDKTVPVVAAEEVSSNSFLDKMMIGLQSLIFGHEKA